MRYLTILGHQLYEATRLPPRGGYVCTSVSLSLARSFCPTNGGGRKRRTSCSTLVSIAIAHLRVRISAPRPLQRKLPWKGYSLGCRNELLDILNRVTR